MQAPPENAKNFASTFKCSDNRVLFCFLTKEAHGRKAFFPSLCAVWGARPLSKRTLGDSWSGTFAPWSSFTFPGLSYLWSTTVWKYSMENSRNKQLGCKLHAVLSSSTKILLHPARTLVISFARRIPTLWTSLPVCHLLTELIIDYCWGAARSMLSTETFDVMSQHLGHFIFHHIVQALCLASQEAWMQWGRERMSLITVYCYSFLLYFWLLLVSYRLNLC